MITFFIGLAMLLVGSFIYGNICERVFKPDNRPTPAVKLNDGMDFVAMPKWKNCLIQLLNIAGTGPILGAIQGILFGPIAFLTIPIGCVFGGALHDYMVGMISMRNDGKQMPKLIKMFLGKWTFYTYNIFVCILLLLLGVVFIYTPGDLLVGKLCNQTVSIDNPLIWIIYGVILVYYFLATLFPIDKIIGKIYPLFGSILILSAIGILISLFFKDFTFTEIWDVGFKSVHPQGLNFIPMFFVTMTCGVVSGFHSTQSTLLARTIKTEHEGKHTFYFMMIAEGFIAMIWAIAAMGIFNNGLATADTDPIAVVGIIAESFLGKIGGITAVIAVIVLAITSGDTALRSLRLIISDSLHISSKNRKYISLIALAIFSVVIMFLIFSKCNADGFNILWRYVACANIATSVFAFSMITAYMKKHNKPFLMALIPGTFYIFIFSSYLLNAKIGFNMPWNQSYIIAGIFSIVYFVLLLFLPRNKTDNTATDKAHNANINTHA